MTPPFEVGPIDGQPVVQPQAPEAVSLPLGHAYFGNLCSGFGGTTECQHYDMEKGRRCGKSPFEHETHPELDAALAPPVVGDEAEARVTELVELGNAIHDGLGSSCSSDEALCIDAAEIVLAAGYVSPATLAQREAAARAEALREAADEWPGWWKFTRWLRDRAASLARTGTEDQGVKS